MAEFHVLGPMRRWLIHPGSPQKVITFLLVTVLVFTAALVALHDATVNGGSDMADIENSGHAGS